MSQRGAQVMSSGLPGEIVQLTMEHLWLVLLSITIAVGIALPMGVLLTRKRPLQGWVLGFANVVQTIPPSRSSAF